MLEKMTTMRVVTLFSVFCLAAIVPTGLAATLTASGSAALLRKELPSRSAKKEPTALDVHADGTASRDHRGEPYIEGLPQMEQSMMEQSLIGAGSWTGSRTDTCGMLVSRVLDSIKFHLGVRKRSSFVSENEAKLYTTLNEGANGVEVLTNAMRVLGNYSLAEGIMAGSIWTVEHQNKFISCMQNIHTRLEEHDKTEHGDVLIQGDMAVTSTDCHYSPKAANSTGWITQLKDSTGVAGGTFNAFAVGTHTCAGEKGCGFRTPDEATHFCNLEAECVGIVFDELSTTGLYYRPIKLTPPGSTSDLWTWHTASKAYIKQCPGSMLELSNAMSQGVRGPGVRWHNGEVAYCFAGDVSRQAQEAFHIAIQNVEKQVPCLHFNRADRVNDTHCDTVPSIIVQSKPSGCWSYLGQVSGREKAWLKRSQPLNLDRGCEMVGFVQHQLGHALGMVHENSRPDRSKVLKLELGNAAKGKANEFGMSQDVVKYAWSGSGLCENRIARTKATMKAVDCTLIKGLASASGVANSGTVECELDLCVDGKYFPGPRNEHQVSLCKDKVAEMAIKMQRKDCHAAKGTSSGDVSWQEQPTQWTDCTFDLCTDMGLHVAKPFSCGNKLAHGYIHTKQHDCENMGGTFPASHVGQDWVNCYVDFCSGQFDSSFDFLSLMMYSPKAWSLTGKETTLVPLGNHSELISGLMGQRMGFSGLDVFHLAHMYNCWDKIKPDFDSKDISANILNGKYFQHEGKCEDAVAEKTGLDVHGELGFMKHAACHDLQQYCHNETDGMGTQVRKACAVSCFECLPTHGTMGKGNGIEGPCFDAVTTGVRFRDGPAASCKDLINYCNHSAIGEAVTTACKLSCGYCQPHIYAPFYDEHKHCSDLKAEEEPQFSIEKSVTACEDLADFCQGHVDSYAVRHKCPHTCGLCYGDNAHMHYKPKISPDINLPADSGDCSRRRSFGFCSTRRRQSMGAAEETTKEWEADHKEGK